jgi:hypothetical protein
MDVRKYYLLFIEKGTDKSLIEKICLETKITERVVKAKLSSYNARNNNEEEKTKYKKVMSHLMEKSKQVDNKQHFPFLNKIYKASSKEEVINLMKENGIKSRLEFSEMVTSYVMHISKFNKEEIVNTVSAILNLHGNCYEQYLNSESEKIRLEKIAKKNSEIKQERYKKRIETIKFLRNIANSEYQTSKEYLEANNIDKTQYKYAIKSIEDSEKPAFVEYCKIMTNKMLDSSMGSENLSLLIEKIQTGFDGRSFDLLDYYEHTKLSQLEMAKICNYGLDTENYRILKTFIGKDMSDEYFDINKEIEAEYTITIDGVQNNPTAEDKLKAYNYMLDRDYPIDYKLYRIVLKRVILDFKKTKIKE